MNMIFVISFAVNEVCVKYYYVISCLSLCINTVHVFVITRAVCHKYNNNNIEVDM